MKTKIITVFLTLFASLNTYTLTAQINIPSDSINNVLCQKWDFKAIVMDGQRITNVNESITYEFLVDGNLIRVSSKGKAESGTWTYNAEQKIISLKIKKKDLFIPVLSYDELIVLSGTGSPGDGAGVAVVFKLIKSN